MYDWKVTAAIWVVNCLRKSQRLLASAMLRAIYYAATSECINSQSSKLSTKETHSAEDIVWHHLRRDDIEKLHPEVHVFLLVGVLGTKRDQLYSSYEKVR